MASWRTRRSASPAASIFGWSGLSFVAHPAKSLHRCDSRIALFGLNLISHAHCLFMTQSTTREPPLPNPSGQAFRGCPISRVRGCVGAGLVSAHLYIRADTRPAPTCGIPRCVIPVETALFDEYETTLRQVPYGNIPLRRPRPAEPTGGVSTNKRRTGFPACQRRTGFPACL